MNKHKINKNSTSIFKEFINITGLYDLICYVSLNHYHDVYIFFNGYSMSLYDFARSIKL